MQVDDFISRLTKYLPIRIRSLLQFVVHILKAINKHGIRKLVYKYNDQFIADCIRILSTYTATILLPDIPKSKNRFYSFWLQHNYPRPTDLASFSDVVKFLNYKPKISLIVLCLNVSDRHIHQTIDSIYRQCYPTWELILIGNSSILSDLQNLLSIELDKTAKTQFIEIEDFIESWPIYINQAIQLATGDFLIFLRAEGCLAPQALYEIALCLNKFPDTDLIYSDEDQIDEQGYLKHPFFKPNWCPDSFLSRMYVGQLTVCRKELVLKVGGLRSEFADAAIYDLLLRITSKHEQIVHLSKVLFHRYSTPDFSAKALGHVHVIQSVEDAISCRGERGHVILNSSGYCTVHYEVKSSDLVTIIIPTRDLGSLLDSCLTSIFEKTDYKNYEVLLVDNGSSEIETLKVIDKWKSQEKNRFRYFYLDVDFNFSYINNQAVKQAEGKYLLFLNNDTEVITPDWLTAMVEQAQRSSIGAVGALLLYPDHTIQHAGILLGVTEIASYSFQYRSASYCGYFGQSQATSNYSAVTAACLMCRREVFDEVGGFNEDLAIAFNDVDLCLKMVEKGYRNVYLPHVMLYHHESKSRGYDLVGKKHERFLEEIAYMQQRWKDWIANDPCYNPNLPKRLADHRKVYI